MNRLEKKITSLKEKILSEVEEYYKLSEQKGLVAPNPYVKYVWRTWDEKELVALVGSALDQKIAYGKIGREFEDEFAKYLNTAHAVSVNSGSSANLVAVSALKAEKFHGKYGRLEDGCEAITPAATFPTTLNALLTNNIIPAFVDVDIGTYNMNLDKIEEAVNEKTKLIMLPHTLGNPNDMDRIMKLAKEKGLYVIEDACDSLGSEYKGKKLGTFGDVGTFSFYLSHHISTGEGGMAVTSNLELKRIMKSLRDWGRDCWCEPYESDTCKKRFDWQLGDLPKGYDHKYVFSNIGFNLKMLDIQAAMGIEQIKKLPMIVENRKKNFNKICEGLKEFEEFIILPESVPGADPCWFSVPLTVRENEKFSREGLVKHLTEKSIETRPFFAGNILRQPAYTHIPRRVVGNLTNTDNVMKNTFFVGCHPLLTEDMISHILNEFKSYFEKK
ncbi:MAG: lipopolysaccharide biosynthesis protein RfbH [Candidatus Pacearchaeota archaeon]